MTKPTKPHDEFDRWAASYDRDAGLNTGFPFEGYSDVLSTIVNKSCAKPGDAVLDLGTGTGNLANLFAQRGCQIWGVDFSPAMLALAQKKLPAARLAQMDLRDDLQVAFPRRYDLIVSAYTFHHFPLDEKVALVSRYLENHLQPGGKFLIGDIAFMTGAEQAATRAVFCETWEQEFYWLADESIAAFKTAGIHLAYTQVSICAGVFLVLN